jgi:hypothetical protein
MKPLIERRRRSARETFAACQRKYQAEYLDGVDMASGATRRGQAWHRAAELYIASLFEGKLTEDLESAQKALSQARVETPGLTFEEFTDLEGLWNRWAPDFRLDLDRHVDIETALPVFGTLLRLDRVQAVDSNTLRTYDAKSHWAITSQGVLDQSWQTNMYLAGMRRVFPGWQRYEMVYEFVRWGVSSEVISKTDAELDAVELSIAESDEAMSTAEDRQVFPATGGKHCGYCTIAHTSCPLVQNGYAPSLTPQDAVGRIAAHDRARSLLVEALRAHVEAYGPVEAGGVEWAHRPKTRTEYPALAVLDILTANELPKAQFRLSATAVKPILTTRKYAWVREQVAAQGIVKSSGTVFSGKAVSSDEDAEPQEAE